MDFGITGLDGKGPSGRFGHRRWAGNAGLGVSGSRFYVRGRVQWDRICTEYYAAQCSH